MTEEFVTEPAMQRPLEHLRSILIPAETLEAWAIQHRLFALTHRRVLVAAPSGRPITLRCRLLWGVCGSRRIGRGPAAAGSQANARGQVDHRRRVRGHQGEDFLVVIVRVRRLWPVLLLATLSACGEAQRQRPEWLIRSRLVFLSED